MENKLENTLLNVIRDWVGKNKKVFWKYEVSSFYKTYQINVVNLPEPSNEDITVLSNKQMLNNTQKEQLCNNIKKACAQAGIMRNSSIKVQIDYENEAVVAEAV